MLTLSIKHIDRTCLIAIVILSMACGYLAVSDVARKKERFGIEKNILSKRITEVNLATLNLGDLKTALAATQKELSHLNERIPEPGKIGLLLKQIDALMTHRNITLVNLQPLPAKEEKIYIKHPIKLMFTGLFDDIYHLLFDLERMNRIVILENMTITRKENSDQCRVELITSVFERKHTGG